MSARDVSKIWDTVHARAPTKDAAVATSGGDHYESAAKPGAIVHWKAPPAMRPVPSGLPDLTGLKGEYLTVVGLRLLEDRASWTRTTWVVRCVCGDYEVRRHKSLAKHRAFAPDDACFECRHVRALRVRGAKPLTKKRREAEEAHLDELAARQRTA